MVGAALVGLPLAPAAAQSAPPDGVAPTEVAPTEVAPTEVAPTEVAPAEPVPAEAAPEAPATTGRLVGRITSEGRGPLADARLILVSPSGDELEGRTDASGGFRFDALAPGAYHLDVVGPDGRVSSLDESVEAGVEVEVVLDVSAERTAEDALYGARAEVDPPPREVTRRTIPREDLARIPGTRGDPLRTVELLPGVARPPFGAGLLIVRGGSPADSEVLLDGAPVPLLYHFGGLTSFLPARFVERIDFQPGNFSTRYGRRVGGIVDVTSRDPATDRLHGTVEASLVDTGVTMEGPLGRRAAFSLGARRSLLDLVLARALPSGGGTSITSAPVYYDYQGFVTVQPSARDRLKLALYGSSDAIRLLFADEGGESSQLVGAARSLIRFTYGQLTWTRTVGTRTEQRITLQAGPQHLDNRFGTSQRLSADLVQLFGRAEWTTALPRGLRLVHGLDALALPYSFAYRGAPPIASEGQPGGDSGAGSIEARGRSSITRVGAYVDVALRHGPLDLNLGQRVELYTDLERATYEPRLSVRVRASDTVQLRAGVGLHSQAPELQESIPGLGNPGLRPTRALHGTVGVDYTPREGVELGLEAFAKHLWDRVVPTEDGASPRFRNGGIGRIVGGEFSLRAHPGDAPWFGYLSYTLMRSERRDPGEQDFRPFDFDQTHILTSSFGYRFPRRWELGGTFRYATGNPYTPIVGSVHDLARGLYVPVYGDVNTARATAFHRLDVRVEKTWQFGPRSLALFLDVQNAYGRRTEEGRIYAYDYRASAPLRGLPVLPSIGLRGEL